MNKEKIERLVSELTKELLSYIDGKFEELKKDLLTLPNDSPPSETAPMNDVPAAPKHFFPKELAQRWKLDPRRIKRLRQQGRLPYVQFGPRDFRFPVDKILEMERDRIDLGQPYPNRSPKKKP